MVRNTPATAAPAAASTATAEELEVDVGTDKLGEGVDTNCADELEVGRPSRENRCNIKVDRHNYVIICSA